MPPSILNRGPAQPRDLLAPGQDGDYGWSRQLRQDLRWPARFTDGNEKLASISLIEMIAWAKERPEPFKLRVKRVARRAT